METQWYREGRNGPQQEDGLVYITLFSNTSLHGPGLILPWWPSFISKVFMSPWGRGFIPLPAPCPLGLEAAILLSNPNSMSTSFGRKLPWWFCCCCCFWGLACFWLWLWLLRRLQSLPRQQATAEMTTIIAKTTNTEPKDPFERWGGDWYVTLVG